MPVEQEELKTMLEAHIGKITDAVQTKLKEQNDSATKELGELRSQLTEAKTALADLQEKMKKPFGMPGLETEKKNWSWGRFFIGMAKDHMARKFTDQASEAKAYWDGPASFEQRVCKDYSAGDGSAGGFIVPPQIYQGDIIDTVYANTAMLRLPTFKLPGLRADMPIPVDNGNLTGYHVGETTAPTKSTTSFGLKWLRPKKVGAYARMSNRIIDASERAIEMIVKDKMTKDLSVELSRGLTNGKGTDSEPMGILQFYTQMTGTGNLGTNGRRFTIDDLASMKQALAVVNELTDLPSNGTLMHPAVLWGMLREKTEMYSGQVARNQQPKYGKILIDQTMIESSLKLKIEATTQIPTGTVGSSSTNTKVITGDWSKFVFATFRDPIFKVSDVASDNSSNSSAFLNDDLLMVMFLEYDCNCLRPTAFCGKDGAETTESNW